MSVANTRQAADKTFVASQAPKTPLKYDVNVALNILNFFHIK